jgi:hypothetical protein
VDVKFLDPELMKQKRRMINLNCDSGSEPDDTNNYKNFIANYKNWIMKKDPSIPSANQELPMDSFFLNLAKKSTN